MIEYNKIKDVLRNKRLVFLTPTKDGMEGLRISKYDPDIVCGIYSLGTKRFLVPITKSQINAIRLKIESGEFLEEDL